MKTFLKKMCMSLAAILMTCCFCLANMNCYAQEQKDGSAGVSVSYVKEKNDTYFLYVTIFGNGSLYDGEGIIREQINKYEIEPGVKKIFTISPDKGYQLDRVLLNNVDITQKVISGKIEIVGEEFNQNLEVYFRKETTQPTNDATRSPVVKTNDSTTIQSLVLIMLVASCIGICILIRKKKDNE